MYAIRVVHKTDGKIVFQTRFIYPTLKAVKVVGKNLKREIPLAESYRFEILKRKVTIHGEI